MTNKTTLCAIVGVDVGTSEGVAVGTFVGANVGMIVGANVGAIVGWVGIMVGDNDGDKEVGIVVGLFETAA